MRRFSDSVEVRVRSLDEVSTAEAQAAPVPERPEAFIWRGRLYVVRDVIAQWRERRAWWRDALDAHESEVTPGSSIAAAASEQRVWRVEASPGWSFPPGVYDLAHDESAPASGAGVARGTSSGQWSLVRVAD